jgi:hypothetical protein
MTRVRLLEGNAKCTVSDCNANNGEKNGKLVFMTGEQINIYNVGHAVTNSMTTDPNFAISEGNCIAIKRHVEMY